MSGPAVELLWDGKAEIGDITGHSSGQTSQDTPLGTHHRTLLCADITGHSSGQTSWDTPLGRHHRTLIYFLDLEKNRTGKNVVGVVSVVSGECREW